jgi:hypothetical protein
MFLSASAAATAWPIFQRRTNGLERDGPALVPEVQEPDREQPSPNSPAAGRHPTHYKSVIL